MFVCLMILHYVLFKHVLKGTLTKIMINSPSLLMSSSIFSVKTLALFRLAKASRTRLAVLWRGNCRLYESTTRRNVSGMMSSESVSGGSSMNANRNDTNSLPTCSGTIEVENTFFYLKEKKNLTEIIT